MKKAKFTVLLTETSDKWLEIVGTQYKSLNTLFLQGIPLPPSFVVTSDAFKFFLDFTDIHKEIRKMIRDKLVNKRRLEKLALDSKMPPILASDINNCYKRISGLSYCHLLVIPYLFSEQLTYPVEGEKTKSAYGEGSLIEAIISSWAAALVSGADILNEILSGNLKVAVVVEKFPIEEVSGVCYTNNIITNDEDNVVIEAVYGNWDIVKKEGVIPDQYIYSKSRKEIIDKHISKQEYMLLKHLKGKSSLTEQVHISSVWQTRQKIDNKHIKYLSKIAEVIEKHFGEPCEIGWVFESGRIWILWIDTIKKLKIALEPITSISIEKPQHPKIIVPEVKPVSLPKKEKRKIKRLSEKELKGFEPTLRGEGNNEGIIKGIVVKNKKDIGRSKNSIWVVSKVYDNDIESIHKVAGLVIDTSDGNDAAIAVSKMLGIPLITKTALASKVLKNGQVVFVDSIEGIIYSSISSKSKSNATKTEYSPTAMMSKIKFDRTATKVVAASKLEVVSKWLKFNDFYDEIVVAPLNIKNIFIDGYIQQFLSMSKPIWLLIESPGELNAITRHIRNIRIKKKIKNLSIILPYYSIKEEIIEAKRILMDNGLRRSSSFQLMIQLNKPINILNALELISVGCDGVWIDSNTLQAELVGEKRKTLTNETISGICRIISDALHSSVRTYLYLPQTSINKKIIRTFVGVGIYGIAGPNINTLVSLRNTIGEVEKEKIMGFYPTALSPHR